MSEFPGGLNEDDFIAYWNSDTNPWIGDALSIDDIIGDVMAAVRAMAGYKQQLAEVRAGLHEIISRADEDDGLACIAISSRLLGLITFVGNPPTSNEAAAEAGGSE
jgi:hypothetical protein